MYEADLPPRSEPDPVADDFLLTLELNALARWWRANAGARGETGARVIAWVRPAATTDPSDAPAGAD